MIFEPFQLQVRGDIATGSYLAGDERSGKVAWIDPAEYNDAVVSMVRQSGWKVVALLVTHGHYDHTGGVGQALQEFRCPVYCSPADAGAWRGEVRKANEGERIAIGSLQVEVYETGGHTPGSLTYRMGPYLFVGDALFAGSVGGTGWRSDFERQQRAIVEKVFAFGDDAVVCPGHGPISTVGVERCYNPFFD